MGKERGRWREAGGGGQKQVFIMQIRGGGVQWMLGQAEGTINTRSPEGPV